jgi:hypothetical protein
MHLSIGSIPACSQSVSAGAGQGLVDKRTVDRALTTSHTDMQSQATHVTLEYVAFIRRMIDGIHDGVIPENLRLARCKLYAHAEYPVSTLTPRCKPIGDR